jgi:hypothetical protein
MLPSMVFMLDLTAIGSAAPVFDTVVATLAAPFVRPNARAT